MVKKKLNILFFTLLSVLFLGLFSTSYATIDKTKLQDDLTKLESKGVLNTGFVDTITNSGYWTSSSSDLNNSSFVSYVLLMYDNKINICLLLYTNNIINATAIASGSYFSERWSFSGTNQTLNFSKEFNLYGVVGTSGNIALNNKTFTYAYTPTNNINTTSLVLAAGEEYGGNYIAKTLPEFIPYKNFENLTVNNISGVYGQTMYSWTEPMQLGYFTNLANHDISLSLLNYELYFVSPDNTETKMDDMLELYHVDIETDTLDITQEIRLKLGKLYKLKITYDGEIIYNIYYIILPVGTGIASGATINYQYTSGDSVYSVQDSTIDIINEDQKNQDEIMGFLTSSDISSGEEPTLQDLSVPVVPDATEDFFTWLMNSVLDILYNNTDSTLEIPLYNTTHYIRSDIYKLNIEPLKTFIQAGWWFIVGVPVLKYIRRSIERLKGGELPATDDKSDLLGNIL